jgi:hypothetical protein
MLDQAHKNAMFKNSRKYPWLPIYYNSCRVLKIKRARLCRLNINKDPANRFLHYCLKTPILVGLHQIELNAQGVILLDGAVVTVAQLKTQLAAAKADDPELGVVVKGDDEVDYQHMVAVLDTLQSLDIQKVGMATQ